MTGTNRSQEVLSYNKFMKKPLAVILALVIALIILSFFFIEKYTTSPGYVSAETAQEFKRNKQVCVGLSIPEKTLKPFGPQVIDAGEKAFCIGWLY